MLEECILINNKCYKNSFMDTIRSDSLSTNFYHSFIRRSMGLPRKREIYLKSL